MWTVKHASPERKFEWWTHPETGERLFVVRRNGWVYDACAGHVFDHATKEIKRIGFEPFYDVR